MRLTHASVFSGIGGPDIAATMLGWDNAFHCEINEFGRKILEYWYPNSKSYEDITKTDFSEWRGKVDVLTGGFPCQPFSYAGKRRGAEDDRYLWPHMFRCIDQVRPAWVVAENVAGILTMVEQGEVSAMESQGNLFDEGDGVRRHRLVETFTLQRICDDLEGHGYEVQPVLVPACAAGAPHRRDRVFIVGRRVDEVERRASADATSNGSSGDTAGASQPSQRQNWQQDEQSAKRGSFRDAQFYSSYTERQPSERMRPQQYEVGREQQEQPRGRDCEVGSVAGCGRWESFPTVSPVHRGNDGLPFPLDDLAIPASKWRTESLKAYGNAIVPQVMYEIFRAIEIVERENL